VGMDVETHATEVGMECLHDPENMLFFLCSFFLNFFRPSHICSSNHAG